MEEDAMNNEYLKDRSQKVRPGLEKPGEPALRGVGVAADEKRADGTPLDSKPEARPAILPTASEDAFIVPAGKIAHEGPPKDPNEPSGSLSADDAEPIVADFTAANPTHPNI
jgi:hypothetical protein